MQLLAIAGHLAGPDKFIVVGYFILMLGIGMYFYRYMRGMKDYFTGGNSIPWWLSGVSYWMSSFSAFAFVTYSAMAYKFGLLGVTVYWVSLPAALFSLIFFAKKWRRARIDSPVEYIETRYSGALRQCFAWQGIPVKIIDDGLKIVAIGKFVSVSLGVGMAPAMFWSSVIMLAYTFMGGLWAVAVTDFVQFIVMMAAVLILFPLAFVEVGGFGTFLQRLPEGFLHFTNSDYTPVYFIVLIVMYALSYSVNWSLIQRYYCVKTEKDAVKVGWLVVGLNVIGPPLMFAPAMAARLFLGDLPDDQQVYPLMCAKLLPAGMFGLVIAAMFSATMSMLSGDYNVVASVLTNDVYRRLIRPQSSNRHLVFVGRLMTLIVGFVSLGIAFLLIGGQGEEQFKKMVKLFSVATAPVAVPMLLGLVSRRFSNISGLTSFLIGVTVGLVLFFTLPDKVQWAGMVWQQETLLVLATLAVTLVTMLTVNAIAPLSGPARARVEAFHERLETPIGGLAEDQPSVAEPGGKELSPFRIVGVTVILTGLMMLAVQYWVTGFMPRMLNALMGGGFLLGGALMYWRSLAVGRASRANPLAE